MRALFMAALLVAGTASAQTFPGGGGSGAASSVDVLAALVGQNVSANSYTATATSGTAFQSTGDLVTAVRLGTAPRATIGTCSGGGVCIGPDDFGFTTKLYVWGDITTQTVVARTFLDVQGSAYIINNSGPVRVTDTDGLVVNGGTALKGRVALAVTFDSASINNGTCLNQAVTVAGALVGDFVRVNADFALPDTVMVGNARVTATNTVSLRLCNIDPALPADPASGPYNFALER